MHRTSNRTPTPCAPVMVPNPYAAGWAYATHQAERRGAAQSSLPSGEQSELSGGVRDER